MDDQEEIYLQGETYFQGSTSKWSLRPPFIDRLCPAETRLKEGANAHDSDRTGGNHSLAAGRWRPVNALRAVSRHRHFDVNSSKAARIHACIVKTENAAGFAASLV